MSANIFDQIDNLLVLPISNSTGQPLDQVRILLVFLA
jgi:lysophospholipid acyltransferase